MVKLPFPVWLLNTNVTIEAKIRGEDGVEKVLLYSGKAIVDEKAQNVMTTERQLVRLNGKVIVQGDLAAGQDIKGYITFNGQERTIANVSRPRNPDGSVFSTELGFE